MKNNRLLIYILLVIAALVLSAIVYMWAGILPHAGNSPVTEILIVFGLLILLALLFESILVVSHVHYHRSEDKK